MQLDDFSTSNLYRSWSKTARQGSHENGLQTEWCVPQTFPFQYKYIHKYKVWTLWAKFHFLQEILIFYLHIFRYIRNRCLAYLVAHPYKYHHLSASFRNGDRVKSLMLTFANAPWPGSRLGLAAETMVIGKWLLVASSRTTSNLMWNQKLVLLTSFI